MARSFSGIVGQVPAENGLHRGEDLARVAVARPAALHAPRDALDNRGHLFQRLLRTRVHGDAPLQRTER
jgi:hypothetical protein